MNQKNYEPKYGVTTTVVIPAPILKRARQLGIERSSLLAEALTERIAEIEAEHPELKEITKSV